MDGMPGVLVGKVSTLVEAFGSAVVVSVKVSLEVSVTVSIKEEGADGISGVEKDAVEGDKMKWVS